ncbi:DNA mismatch repair protein MutS [Thermus sp. LT1-2-5]
MRSFLRAMEEAHTWLNLAEKARHVWQKRLYFLQGARAYTQGVEDLVRAWKESWPKSSGLQGYAAYLKAYVEGEGFASLVRATGRVLEALGGVRYALHVHEGRLTLRVYQGEPDYGKQVEATFLPFFGPTPRGLPRPPEGPSPWLNHVEEWILDHLALLFTQAFSDLEAFRRDHADFWDGSVARLEREVRFFLAYLDLIAPLQALGLAFTLPEPASAPPFFAQDSFDLVLALKLAAEGKRPVTNDVTFGPERILVVTGPNQGGKTTFARMVGQVVYLFALGLPVPGRRGRLPLPDRILTHFPAQEDPTELKSQLEAELTRLKALLGEASGESLLLFNEPLAGASLRDAQVLGSFLLERVADKACLAVVVTFWEVLSHFPGVKSLVAEVDPEDLSRRTFRIVPRPADGKVYALALAERYGITEAALRRRLGGGK